MTNPFTPADKFKMPLKLLMMGPSKTGKTYTALKLAEELARLEQGKIALIDTEYGKSALYAPPFSFDMMTLWNNFHPDAYIRAIQDACAADYKVLIIDSASPMWNADNGILQIVDNSRRGKFGGWSEATPLYRKFLRVLMGAPIHTIVTTRAQSEYQLQKNEKGKDIYVEVGTNPIQHKEFKFEFDVHLMMTTQHTMQVEGTRYSPIDRLEIEDPVWLAQELHAWVTRGDTPKHRKAKDTWMTAKFMNDLIREFGIQDHQHQAYREAVGVPEGGNMGDSTLSISAFREAIQQQYKKLQSDTGDWIDGIDDTPEEKAS